jgi:hypothetical protein
MIRLRYVNRILLPLTGTAVDLGAGRLSQPNIGRRKKLQDTNFSWF